MSDPTYYRRFDHVKPPHTPPLGAVQQFLWQFFAIFSLGLALWYLHWRYTSSFNPDALWFSWLIFATELLCFIGLCLFYFDIWEEGKKRDIKRPNAAQAGGNKVDVFITTYDEDLDLVTDSLRDAQAMHVPAGFSAKIHVLDDGNRPDLKKRVLALGANYITRTDNQGFKAGNVKNALWQTNGDFIVIADADTRLFPSFLSSTLGYFHEANVAWVQTPHWFYDISMGQSIADMGGRIARYFTRAWGNFARFGADPYGSDPQIFFDVIQRRRDRHGASFCCGAGSIHRREPLFELALKRTRNARKTNKRPLLEPFKFHVSEDIFTSILMHSMAHKSWVSVYHPRIEAKMLSPQSLEAWAAQRLKYAGGTFDILFSQWGGLRQRLPWRMLLHYWATFYSYLMVIPSLVLIIAPAFTLLTGISPVAAYSVDFFLHLLPLLAVMELALLFGLMGYNLHASRMNTIASLPYVLYALVQVVMGRKIGFKPTPKTLLRGKQHRFVRPHLALLCLYICAISWAGFQYISGNGAFGIGLIIVNVFWIMWNALALIHIIKLAFLPPKIQTPNNENIYNQRGQNGIKP